MGERNRHFSRDDHLTFADHVHQFNSSQNVSSGVEGFETHYGVGDPFHRSLTVLYDVVELFVLANQDRLFSVLVDLVQRGFVGSVFVNRDLLRIPIRAHRLLEESCRRCVVPLGPQQKIDGSPSLSTARHRSLHWPFTFK